MSPRFRKWNSALHKSYAARRQNWYGCSNTHRSIPPARAPGTRICWIQGGFRCIAQAEAGRFTYHGPGQRIAYVMLDLNRRRRDVREFVRDLESWVIAALASFNVKGERRADRIGIWVERGVGSKDGPLDEDKIATIGVRIRRWVSFPRHRNQRRSRTRAFLGHRSLWR